MIPVASTIPFLLAFFPFAKNDQKLLEDPILVDLIGLLADFADFDRYYDMDCIGGEDKIKNGVRKLSPEDKWGKLKYINE